LSTENGNPLGGTIGLNAVGVTTEVPDSASGLRLGLTGEDVLLDGHGGTARPTPHRRRLPVAFAPWASTWSRISWLRALIAVAIPLLAFAFVHPLVHRAPGLRTAGETVMTVTAVITAGLFAAQFVHTRRLRKLLLLAALVILTLGEFTAHALPAALQAHSGATFTASLPLGQLFAAAILAAAAFTPSDRLIVGDSRPLLMITASAALGAFGVAQLGGMLLDGQMIGGTAHRQLGIERTLHHPPGLVVVIVTVLFFAYAAIAFARRGRGERNAFLTLLGGVAAVLAAVQLYYLRLPSSSVDAITFRQVLMALALGLLLVAALRKDLEIRAARTRAAAMAERRRVAEDLHDGLAQDLALIAAHGARMARELGDDYPLAVAAKRALAVSRKTISGLSDMSATPPAQALEAIAQELGDRFGVGIAVDAQPDAPVPVDARDDIARIAREAIANAARHGGARNIVVSLRRTELGVSLRVCDDGCGIAAGGGPAPSEGFGLRSLRERAAALGGWLHVRERRAGGTELEVFLP
jgi:signal transduction histidine kinase